MDKQCPVCKRWYRTCRACGKPVADWSDFCESCLKNGVDVNCAICKKPIRYPGGPGFKVTTTEEHYEDMDVETVYVCPDCNPMKLLDDCDEISVERL